MVSTRGLNKAEVIAALYNHARPQGLGFLQYEPGDMTIQEAEEIVLRGRPFYFDYLKGRVMKVNLDSDNEFDERLYDRDNGEGAAQRAIDRMKELAPAIKNMEKLAREFSDDPEQILPEPGALESAKGYREKKAKPLLERIVKVLRSVYHAFLNLRNDYDRLQQRFSRECAKTARMGDQIDELADENKILRGIVADFDRVKKALGKDKVEAAVESVKQEEARVQAEKHRKRQYTR